MSWATTTALAGAALALKATALIGAGLLGAFALRRASASTRHFLWGAVVLGVLTLPVVSPVMPAWPPVDWTLISGEDARRAGDVGTSPPDAGEASAQAARPWAAADPADVGRDPGTKPSEGIGIGLPLDRTAEAATAAVLAWLVGAVLALVLMGRSVRTLRTLVGEGRTLPADDPRVRRLQDRARRVGVNRVPGAVESPSCAVPFVWGFRTPRIVLPAGSGSWSAARLDAVLLHELAHVRQRDVPLRLAAEVMCALHWFNPLAWMAARRLRAEGEAACDDAVLATGTAPETYAGVLLGMGVERRWRLRAAGAMAGASSLGRRIDALLDPSRPRKPSRALRGAVALAAAGLVPAVAALGPAPARASSPGPTSRGRTSPPPAPATAAVQARWSAGPEVGALFTEGSVDLDGGDAAEEAGGPGFFLLVHRGEDGALRSVRAVAGPDGAAARAVREGVDGSAPWPERTPAWLASALEVSAVKLAGLGRDVRWRGASLGREGAPRATDGVSGSVMTGLPATTEDGSRGTLVAGWRWGGLRAGLVACAEPTGTDGSASARALVARAAGARGGPEALAAGECLVAFTWNPRAGTLRVLEAWRAADGVLRVHATEGARSVPVAATRGWLEALLRSAETALAR